MTAKSLSISPTWHPVAPRAVKKPEAKPAPHVSPEAAAARPPSRFALTFKKMVHFVGDSMACWATAGRISRPGN